MQKTERETAGVCKRERQRERESKREGKRVSREGAAGCSGATGIKANFVDPSGVCIMKSYPHPAGNKCHDKSAILPSCQFPAPICLLVASRHSHSLSAASHQRHVHTSLPLLTPSVSLFM